MSELSKEAIALLEQGRIVDAIKMTRVSTGLGLKEAKDLVDTYLLQHPELKAQMPTISQESIFRMVVVLIAVAAMLWLFFKN